ncbi:hypothetical protein DPSP01_000594 [Paraphaeosphaeria sporulosa]|uniref:Uncharacterized protein n=1 Tax=Paraphaeosphaeria sporulosa TaxID=1460663 RepID=A0A177CA41_9PLEO|nr:uncharacterized protein CC84DRAFT_1260817 [Paraphaeosphaeria sporulosa]OAG03712.1 hypothetical protein CC84DRAFT_1260817 [Paraphaeosphaeria sporulosa]
MSLPPSLLLLLVAILPAAASPITPETYLLHKRSASPHNIGIGFAIGLSVLLVASIIFYLGVQRGRTGTWFCWRAPLASLSPAPLGEKAHPINTDMLKSRISSPIQMHSSALPELSPVEVQPRVAELPSPLEEKPKFLELSATNEKAIYEMGLASPRRPPSAASMEEKSFYSSRKSSIATAYRKSFASVKTSGKSVYSTQERPPKVNSWFDRKSWFCRGAMEVEDEEKKIRGKGAAEDEDTRVLAPPPTAVIADEAEADRRQSHMDWSGMEWLTKVYNGRKSRRLSGMRSFFIAGDEK